MALKYLTHPFIVKIKDNEEYQDMESFNDSYIIAYKSDERWIYLTLDAYKLIDSYDDISSLTYGTDYIYSDLYDGIVSHQDMIKSIDTLVNNVVSNRISGYSSDGIKLYSMSLVNDKIYVLLSDMTAMFDSSVLQGIIKMIRYIIANNKNIPSSNDIYNVSISYNGLSQSLETSGLNYGTTTPIVESLIDRFFNTISTVENETESDMVGCVISLSVLPKEHETITKTFEMNFVKDDIVLEEQEKSVTSLTDSIQYLPQLILSDGTFNSDYFDEELTISANKDMIDYYKSLNEYVNNHKFTDEELASLCATFCKVILDMSLIEEPLSSTNEVYKMVLNFYANEGTDDILDKFSLLKGIAASSNTSCGCSSSSSCYTVTSSTSSYYTTTSNTTTSNYTCDCSAIYKTYMETMLYTMLGDTSFYEDWFADNDELPNVLIELLNEFKEQGYLLDFSDGLTKANSCASIANAASDCNYATIDNYIKVLEWVRDGEIESNKNKIKSYGLAFGKLLPNLMF